MTRNMWLSFPPESAGDGSAGERACAHSVSSPRSGLDASQILREVTPSCPGPAQLGPKSVQDALLGAMTLWERGVGEPNTEEGGREQVPWALPGRQSSTPPSEGPRPRDPASLATSLLPPEK